MMPLAACKKDFLNGQPFSSTSTSSFYKTASDAEEALVGCYAILNAGTAQGKTGGIFYTQFPTMGMAATDEVVTASGKTDANYAPMGLAAWNSQSNFVQDTWSFLYIGINRCNMLLEALPGITMDTNRKSQVAAEARFLRGWEYLYLGMMYGGVPLVLESNPANNLPRNAVKEVFAQVFSDLSFAYQNLPSRAAIAGRANKYSAAGYLAKAYEFAASCSRNNVGKELNFNLNDFSWADPADLYAKALSLTTDIVNNSGYVLIPKYDYLFRETTKSFQYKEFLFNTESSSDPANGNQPTYQPTLIPLGNNALYGGGTCRLVPTGELYAKYASNTRATPTVPVYADYRRTWNFSTGLGNAPGYETVEGVGYYVPLPITSVTNKIFYGSKFRYRDPKLKNITLNNTDDNFPLLRYAEVLLMHAEAIYFASGDVATARTFLSQIRKRAVPPTLTTPTDINNALAAMNAAYTNADFVQELLDERARELCFEGSRHFDLTRFGRYTAVINSLSTDRSKGYNNTVVSLIQQNWQPYRIWFPIAYNELLLDPALVQNPGY